MTKEELIEIIQRILKVDDVELGFLVKLSKSELEILASCIRYRIDYDKD